MFIRGRHSLRLKNWDYRKPGSYFITICVNDGIHYFNTPLLKQIVEKYWLKIPVNNPHTALGEYVIMPDHVHGIINIRRYPDSYRDKPFPVNSDKISDYRLPGSIGSIIQGFKTVTKRSIRYHDIYKYFSWQRDFWDRIIRDDREYWAIENYIRKNPVKLKIT
jgi:REP element-mobilizing transposase RayT